MAHLLSKNSHGRIYVKKALIEKLVYKVIINHYPELKVSYLKYDETNLYIYLKKVDTLNDKKIENVVTELTDIFNENYGIYVEGVNIEFIK